jgi:uncharacterized protein (DUF934 family)
MPKLIRHGAITEDDWIPADDGEGRHDARQILTLEQWQAAEDKQGTGVQLEPDHACAPLLDHLDEIALIAINFPVFTDGRGFSYGRELREKGYDGELRAVGNFIRDQVYYLSRCGFDAFQLDDESALPGVLLSLADFSEYYQASANEPQPLFRRCER